MIVEKNEKHEKLRRETAGKSHRETSEHFVSVERESLVGGKAGVGFSPWSGK